MSIFQKIGIVVYRIDTDTHDTFFHLVDFLKRQQIAVVVTTKTQTVFDKDSDSSEKLAKLNIEVVELQDMRPHCELIIVIGGDGSMLHTARETLGLDLPILGINRGRLGFLNDISPDEMQRQLQQILSGEYTSSSRFLFDAGIYNRGEQIQQFWALNDVVIQSVRSRIIDLSLSIDNDFVYKLRADGLIIATPTGSTAYALACGGSIVHPSLDAIEIVPINSHSLDNRPIVVDSNVELEVSITNHNMAKVQAVGDGQLDYPIDVGETLKVKRHTKKVKFIHLKTHNFYQSCRTKLNWNKQ